MHIKRVFQLRKTRNFGQKLEGAFEFIRVTAKPLFKSLFFFTSPFILVGMFLISNLLTASFNFGINSGQGIEPDFQELMSLGLSAFGFMFLMAFAGTMVMSVVFSTIKVYDQRQSADFTHTDVWQEVKKIYWTIFGTTLLYGVIFFVAYIIIMVPMAMLMVFLSILIVPVIYLFFGFFLVVMLMGLSSQTLGRKNLGDSISYAFRLLKGNWWSSLGLLILLMIIYNVITVAFSMPFYLSFVINMMNTVEMDFMQDPPLYQTLLNYLFGAILLIGSFLSYSIPLVGMSLQYFSLTEIKDAPSLIQQIDSFGENEEEEEESY